jgi:AraC-like DNA-binding protein
VSDVQRVELRTTDGAGPLVASASGAVVPSTSPDLLHGLVKLLGEGEPVLVDISGLQLDWAPAAEVFVTAVTAAGGWPLARLALFGADPAATERLRSCRVTEAMPVVATRDEAAALVRTRPARLSRRIDLPAVPGSVDAARAFLRDTYHRWDLPERDDAAVVVAELVGNAVVHSGTAPRLRLVLDHTGLRVSVRDEVPGTISVGRGLRAVARRSRSWGVLHYRDGKAVWAHLPSGRGRPPALTAVDEPHTAPRDRPPATLAAPRRRRFTTADPEQADAFLRTVYGSHTTRFADTDLSGYHLEYDGVATRRFGVEHIRQSADVESLFAPADALVVLHPLAGSLRVSSRRDELSAEPGDLLLFDAGTDVRLVSAHLDVEAVRLDSAAVARVAAELTGFDARTLPIDLCRAVSPARAAYWRAMVAHLRRDVLTSDEVLDGPLTRTALFRGLVATLLETFPNPAVAARNADGHGRATPVTLRRAVRYIEEHAGDDIGLADIAAAAGLGARGLQLAFRRHHDVTPLEYLRRVRLDRAHRDLQVATPADSTVGGIADRWGFPHHGNFSALYLRTYGRSPSITLRS